MYISQAIVECKPAQDYKELREFFEFLVPYDPKVILEIGLYECGLLRLWEKVFNPDIVIGIDDTSIPLEVTNRINFGAHIIAPAKSQDRNTYEQVKKLLDNKPIDLLFIDGDHHYNEVNQDFKMYSKLLANDGLVVFHDINVGDYDFCQVQSFWNDTKKYYKYKEIKYTVGIGIVFWTSPS